MLDWRIYYADGTTYSSDDGPPEQAPALGVLVIVGWDTVNNRRMLLHGDGPSIIDWFWWEGGQWLGGDFAGLLQHLALPGWHKVLVGRYVPNVQFREVMAVAQDDTLDR